METSKFDDDYTQHVYVMLTRKPGKRFLKHCFELSNNPRPPPNLMPRKQGIWGNYSKLVRHRFNGEALPSQRSMGHAKRLMRLAYRMEEEYPK